MSAIKIHSLDCSYSDCLSGAGFIHRFCTIELATAQIASQAREVSVIKSTHLMITSLEKSERADIQQFCKVTTI